MRAPTIAMLALFACSACQGETAPRVHAKGREKTAETKALTAAADVIQRMPPVGNISLYLVGFHPMKDDPSQVMEAHHYCTQVNEDFAQCVLFDGNTGDANMNGVEYIISEKLFEALPKEERGFWHPHNYEILSGQLVAPGIPEAAEKEALEKKMNSYGKTWHVWHTDQKGKAQNALPVGPPMLAWSFNADGEIPEQMLKARDERLGINTLDKRKNRKDLARLAHPQEGVDALASRYPQRVKPEGVMAKGPERGPETGSEPTKRAR